MTHIAPAPAASGPNITHLAREDEPQNMVVNILAKNHLQPLLHNTELLTDFLVHVRGTTDETEKNAQRTFLKV